MKAIKHKQSSEYRIMQRGVFYYVQHSDTRKSSREYDPWYDVGKGQNNAAEALKVMYDFLPMRP